MELYTDNRQNPEMLYKHTVKKPDWIPARESLWDSAWHPWYKKTQTLQFNSQDYNLSEPPYTNRKGPKIVLKMVKKLLFE